MHTCGIVAEYNPFHAGHIRHIEETKKQSSADVFIACMSGNFVQRGEPAVTDKFQRAEAAVRNGIDAVIELPYIYACQSASNFAKGAVHFLQNAGADEISFGSECGNLENLMEIVDTPVNPDHLHESLHAGISFPRAYSLLTSSMEPNDILAVSYLRAIKNTGIRPILVQRTSGYLDDTLCDTPSALAVRTALKEHRSVQGKTVMADALENAEIPWPELYYPYLRTLLLTTDRERLSSFFLINEGIENHLVKNAAACADWNSFLNACTNYRYTASRIKRSCLMIMNQITKQEVKALSEPDFIRVLAFNEKGRAWLHDMRSKPVHVCSKFADVPWLWRAMEYKTTLLYTSVLSEEHRRAVLDQEIRGAHYVQTK